MESLHAAAVETIVASPLARHADALTRALRPSIRLVPRPDEGSLALGQSRLGGRPDLPSGVPWPEWEAYRLGSDFLPNFLKRYRKPLHFLAQIDLRGSAPFDHTGLLPRDGWLWFFYDADTQPWGFDPRDRGAARVLYSDDSNLQPTAPPAKKLDFNSRALDFRAELTLPDTFPGHPRNEVLPAEIYEPYETLCASLESEACVTMHRLLGHPQPVQNDTMDEECQLVSHGVYCGGALDASAEALKKNASDWILLLQIDSDDGTGWMWGDLGRIYFWIRRQDLAARNFDDVWLVLQCS